MDLIANYPLAIYLVFKKVPSDVTICTLQYPWVTVHSGTRNSMKFSL